MSSKRRILAFVAICMSFYLIALGALFANQRSLIFAAPDRPWPNTNDFRTITYRTSDGLSLRGLFRPAAPGKPTVIFFHGNGDSLSGSLVATEAFAAAGYGLLLHEYRGYGGNPGAPNEAGLYADGRAARTWLSNEGVPLDHQILIGFSLGTGLATQLAMETKPAALVLISPYTSMPDAVSSRFRGFIPAQWLVLDRFETSAKLARVNAPVLILHDRDDRLIPVAQGERLATLVPIAKLIVFSGHGHALGYSTEAQSAEIDWLAGLNPKLANQIPSTAYHP